MLRLLTTESKVSVQNVMLMNSCQGAWSLYSHQHVIYRHISEEQINADGATVAELFEQNMSKASRRRPHEASSSYSSTEGGPPRLLTTRREALHLYREIMRYSNLFVWKDDKGVPWRDILRQVPVNWKIMVVTKSLSD